MTILITGATSGIGLATATILARQGRDIALAGRSEQTASVAAATVRGDAADASVSWYAADFAYPAQVSALAHDVRAQHPNLDGLVLCAAVANPDHPATEGIASTRRSRSTISHRCC